MRLLARSLMFSAVALAGFNAQAAVPDVANAVFHDEGMAVPLHDGAVYIYDSGNGAMKPALAVCRNTKTKAEAALSASGCADGFEQGFIDPTSQQPVGEGMGVSEFADYRLLDASDATALGFTTRDGRKFAAVLIANYPGGSGVFVSLGLVSAEGTGRQGSRLVPLGDRVAPQRLVFDATTQQLRVTFLERGPSDSMASPPGKRVQRSFRIKGGELVEVKATQRKGR